MNTETTWVGTKHARAMKTKIAIGLALLAAVSCTREPFEPALFSDIHEITATIDPDGPATRAILIDNPGVRMDASWTGGDKIGLSGPNGSAVSFQVAESDITVDGKSALFRSTDGVPSGALTAFFPWQEGTSVSGGKLTMDFPAVQHFTTGKGVPQPDPAVALMAGTGTAENGVAFRNVLAILKIGQAFDKETTVTKVEFRDLSGKAVSGRITIDPADNYASTVSGGETVLTLDCGEGVELQPGKLGKFFLLVPAREYPRGVEITFVTSDGERFARTTGTSVGVTLGRGVIYPVGDIPNQDYVSGTGASKLASNAILMTPELLRNTVILAQDKFYVRNLDGGYVTIDGYSPVMKPYYEMILPNNLGLQQGSYVVFEATDDLPGGGVYQVTQYESPFADTDHCRVYLEMTADFAKAFDKVDFGGEMFDGEGNLIEDAGLELDIPNYLKEVIDTEGEPVAYTVTPEGTIAFSAEDTERILTRAILTADKSITLPGLKTSYSGDYCSATLGAELTIGMKAACKIDRGELEFVHFTFNPSLKLDAEFSITKKLSFSKTIPLFTLVCGGIPVAPGVIVVPEIYVSATLGANAEIKLTTNISYTYDMGRFGFSYQNGVGFSFRHFEAEPKKKDITPEMGATLAGTLTVSSGILVEPYLSLYGLFGAGIQTEFKLSLSYEHKWTIPTGETPLHLVNERCLRLTPSLTFTPHTASLGGYFSKKWENLQSEIKFDPIWERYLFPTVDRADNAYYTYAMQGKSMNTTTYRFARNGKYGLITFNSDNFPSRQPAVLTYSYDGVAYAIQTPADKPTLDDFQIVCDICNASTTQSWWDLAGKSTPFWRGNEDYYMGTPSQRFILLDIPAGNTQKLVAQGLVGSSGLFPSGKVMSVMILAVNKRTGDETPISWTKPFQFYWPSSPYGSIFSVSSIFETQYYDSEGRVVTAEEIYNSYDKTLIWPDDLPLP